MSIDKQKLQSLLWSEVAAWKADCSEWKRNTEALQEFLGDKTVEEVALELLAENEALRDSANFRAIQSLRKDCEVLRKDAERYQWLRENAQQDVDGWRNETPVLVHAMSHTPEWKARIDESIDAGMAGAVQP